MKTAIIFSEQWRVIAEYDFPLTPSRGDAVIGKDELEYEVHAVVINIQKNTIEILVSQS